MIAKFDCSKLDLAHEISRAMLRAHAALFGHTEVITQKANWIHIRKFILFLQSSDLKYCVPLPASIANEYHRWLKNSGLNGSTAQGHQNVAVSVLRWCGRNTPNVVKKGAAFSVPSFSRDQPQERDVMPMEMAKIVLDICYSRIEDIEDRIRKGWAAVEDANAGISVGSEIGATIRDLLNLGSGQFPQQKDISRAGNNLSRRVANLGGIAELKSNIYVTFRDILPFYLAVIVQTGGNPMSIRRLKIDCITSHPFRDDIEYLDWEKKRAGREQRVDFPVGREWSAPNIVRRLIALNNGLRVYAKSLDRHQVFLSIELKGNRAVVQSVQSLHNYLAEFISENGLIDFNFDGWRFLYARSHHEASGSIDVSKKKLNHRNSRTTSKYTSIERFPSKLHKALTRFQGQLIVAENFSKSGGKNDARDGGKSGKRSATVFGFDCKNPYEGADGVTPAGVRCENFTVCSTCRGSMVPLDDVNVIARILAAKVALEAAKKRALLHGWIARFNDLYSETLDIINKEILVAVAPAVLEKAAAFVELNKIPDLE
ncbi:hypothetical protein HT746_25055 [Burkholderia pyrrocinia]|uniref:hypothetical protein n=1 Tax=Burkholderia pyrrocinia TaxID=60550 RepID=UPI0015765E50|nr:hypothetical protein [Burkholderia pyrrocinia]NTX30346.1 hypothetical protein [Burkholderia pyrrocinia]